MFNSTTYATIQQLDAAAQSKPSNCTGRARWGYGARAASYKYLASKPGMTEAVLAGVLRQAQRDAK